MCCHYALFKKHSMTKITPFIAGQITQYHTSSRSVNATAKHFGHHWGTIEKVLTSGGPTGVYKKRKISAAIKKRRALVHKLALTVDSKNGVTFPSFPSAPAICNELINRGYCVKAKSVQRDLVILKMTSYVRKKVPTRCPDTEKARYKFCVAELKKGKAVLRRYCFSDEHGTSTNDHSDRRQWADTPDQVIPRENLRIHNAHRLQVWACIGVGYKSPIIFLKKKQARDDDEKKSFRQNATTYINKCLSKVTSHLQPPRIFQQDGATCHTAGRVYRYLETKGVVVLIGWPPYSPDLNPIEELWAELDRRISNLHPQTAQQLEEATRAAWASIPQSMIDNYVLSFEAKCRKCVKNRGKCSTV